MTSINTHRLNRRGESESGVTLMLAILVLSAVVAIAFSLATIVFIEIRSSGDATRTEPALYASFAVTEEKLFQYKRFVPTNSQPSRSDTCLVKNECTVNGVSLDLPGNQPPDYDESPKVVFVPKNTIKTIPMFIDGEYDKLYNSISLQLLKGGNFLDYYFKAIDENGNPYPPDNVPNTKYRATTAAAEAYTGFVDNRQYELVLDNSANSQDVSVVIKTWGTDGSPKGLPFVGEEMLKIRAQYRDLNRTYQVRIPIP
jgi:hypothetical protein